MPKEITHWHIGIESLKSSPTLFSMLQSHEEYQAAFLLGAITHDSGYYADIVIRGADEVAEFLHGKDGEDTYSIVRGLILSGLNDTHGVDNIKIFFALGLLSHIILDSVLHPLIYYLTGDYYSHSKSNRKKARTAHRNSESILDAFLISKTSTPYSKYNIPKLLRTIGEAEVLSLSKSIYTECIKHKKFFSFKQKSFYTYWKYHSFLHYVFSSKSIGSSIRKFPLLPYSIRALGYFYKKDKFTLIETPVRFKDSNISMEQLLLKGQLALSNKFQEFENYLLGDRNVSNLFLSEYGPSLNSGVPKQGLPDPIYSIMTDFESL